MTYKGYIGQVELDDENHIFSGTVINVRDVITFHGESVQELESELQASVDDYLAWCMEDGVEPEKPYSGKFNVHLSPALHQRAAVEARRCGLSLNRFVAQSLEDELCLAKSI